MAFRRVREWFADRFRWAQYPQQQFIPVRPAPSDLVTWEESLLFFVISLMLGMPALLLMGFAVFVVLVWFFVPVPH